MPTSQVLVLGAVAGLTVFLGLPIARLRRPWPSVQAFLNAGAGGVLLFILLDIIKKVLVERAGTELHGGTFPGLALLFIAGLLAGVVGITSYERLLRRRRRRGASPEQLAISIAIAIGLHNLSEGLAIGASAATGELKLAVVLVVGFALHNATEGFGIAAPLAAAGHGPASWKLLASAGLIAGGPTFVGTLIGVRFADPVLFVLFLALAAGAIIYVLGKLAHVARRLAVPAMAVTGVLIGFLAGFATDLMLAGGT